MNNARQIIYNAICTAADTGAVCPTNGELGALVGLSGSQASDLVRKMSRAGLLTSTGSGGRRVITVHATGKSTMRTRYNRQDIAYSDFNNRGHDSRGNTSDMAKGCERLHQATLTLYAKMANSRGVGMKTAMWHAQHGQDMVERVAA